MSENDKRQEKEQENGREKEIKRVDLTQRLIGAIVLVSLGIILIPLILNGGPERLLSDSGDTNIPPIPKKLTRKLPDIPQSEPMPAPKKIIAYPQEVYNNKTKEPVSPVVSDKHYKKISRPVSKKITMAYTLQIASFSKKDNALGLQKQLRKKGFKAYIEFISTAKGQFYRLRVGPYLKFEQISTIKQQLKIQFKLKNTMIVKYKTA